MTLIAHHFHKPWKPLPPQTGTVYDYLIGSNGVFIRAERPEFSAIVLDQAVKPSIQGLGKIEPQFQWKLPRVPLRLVDGMMAQAVSVKPFRETRFYFLWENETWSRVCPPQFGTASSVRLLDPYSPVHQNGIIEIHSHPPHSDEFSDLDDRSATEFRVYGLMTHIDTHPRLKVRVGINGRFLNVERDQVFEPEVLF